MDSCRQDKLISSVWEEHERPLKGNVLRGRAGKEEEEEEDGTGLQVLYVYVCVCEVCSHVNKHMSSKNYTELVQRDV